MMIAQGGVIVGMEFVRTELTDAGEWVEDEEQLVRLKTNYVISAFGSGLNDTDVHKAMEPIKVSVWGEKKKRRERRIRTRICKGFWGSPSCLLNDHDKNEKLRVVRMKHQ